MLKRGCSRGGAQEGVLRSGCSGGGAQEGVLSKLADDTSSKIRYSVIDHLNIL